MARLTAALQLPADQGVGRIGQGHGEQGLSMAVAEALLGQGLDLVHTTRLQVVAAATAGSTWPISLRLVISWRQPQAAGQPLELAVELLSRESMVTGAPASRLALEQLLGGLERQLPARRRSAGGALVD